MRAAAAAEPAGALDPRGPAAAEIADLWWVMLILGAAIFAFFVAGLAWALLRRPRGDEDDPSQPPPATAGRWIVLGGVALPVVTVGAVLAFTVDTMVSLPDQGGEDALVVEVTGHRWWWSFEYPEHGVVTATELHVPVDRPVELRLLSADVIHSFWVPTVAGKIDALPDGSNTLVVEVDEPGSLRGACAEFCGLQHAKMDFRVIAEPPDEFDAWLAAQREPAATPSTEEASVGHDLFIGQGCAGCHTIAGTEADGTTGPDLTHLGSRGTLTSGGPMTAEELRSWVTDPHESKSGVEMPATPLEPAELDALVAYLEGLR